MNKHFSKRDIENMDERYRAHFVNSLSGFKSANLVGTKSHDGLENLAIVSSVLHLGSSPALMGMVMRPDTVRRDTLENIQNTLFYTLNHVVNDDVPKAHQTSARYDREESEFETTGLANEYLDNFHAPFVQSSPVKLGMKLVEIMPIKHNGTLFIIGSVEHAYVAESALADDGFVSLSSQNVVCINGLDAYLSPQAPRRYAYAKKEKPTSLL